MLIGFLAACGTLFSWSFGTLAFLNASRRMDPGLLNRARLLLAVVATFVLASITMQVWPWQLFSNTGINQWMWLGISGVVGLALGDLFGFTSLRILGARRQSVLSTIAPAAAAITAGADAQVTVILAQATQEAALLRAAGQSKASTIYAKAYGQNPTFFSLYRRLKAYQETFSNNNNMFVVDTNNDFFNLLQQGTGSHAESIK